MYKSECCQENTELLAKFLIQGALVRSLKPDYCETSAIQIYKERGYTLRMACIAETEDHLHDKIALI